METEKVRIHCLSLPPSPLPRLGTALTVLAAAVVAAVTAVVVVVVGAGAESRQSERDRLYAEDSHSLPRLRRQSSEQFGVQMSIRKLKLHPSRSVHY